jgi:hypothetical protein
MALIIVTAVKNLKSYIKDIHFLLQNIHVWELLQLPPLERYKDLAGEVHRKLSHVGIEIQLDIKQLTN